MTNQEQRHLDELREIALEDDSPMSSRDIEFIFSLDRQRNKDLSERQAPWFDDLVKRHLSPR